MTFIVLPSRGSTTVTKRDQSILVKKKYIYEKIKDLKDSVHIIFIIPTPLFQEPPPLFFHVYGGCSSCVWVVQLIINESWVVLGRVGVRDIVPLIPGSGWDFRVYTSYIYETNRLFEPRLL